MNKDRHPDKTGCKTGGDDRAARQALALRENLARRKAQARSRAEGAGGNGGGGVTAGSNITIPGDEPRGDSED